MSENPFTSPEHDKKDPYRHWTNAYKLKRLNVYRFFVILTFFGVLVSVYQLLMRYVVDGVLSLGKLAITVATLVICSCAGLLVRHYRREVEKQMRRQGQVRSRSQPLKTSDPK